MPRFVVHPAIAVISLVISLAGGLAAAAPAVAVPPNIPPGEYMVYEYEAGGGEHDPYRWRFTTDCGPGCLRGTAVDIGWSVDLHEGAFERVDGTIVPSWRGEHWNQDGLACTGGDKPNTGPFNQTWIFTEDLAGTVFMHWTPETSSCFGETTGTRADLRLVPA